jgi:sugar-specific transcriptional regulator TrmB
LNGKDEHTATLVKLGLTTLQARIYLTVLTLQKANVGKISNTAEIARPDVYRVLPTLEKLGLVRKILASPIIYEPTPLKDACTLLLQRKKEEYNEAQEKSMTLIKEFNERTQIIIGESGTEHFVIINSKELLLEKFREADVATEKSVDIISDWHTIRGLLLGCIEASEQAMKRGVKIRLVTDKESFDRRAEAESKKNPLLEVRYLDGPVPVRAGIYDGKLANMRVRTKEDTEMVPSLWSDNPDFIKVMVGYFECLWYRAKQAPKK